MIHEIQFGTIQRDNLLAASLPLDVHALSLAVSTNIIPSLDLPLPLRHCTSPLVLPFIHFQCLL